MAQNIGEAQIGLSVDTSRMEREVSAALKRLESRGFNLGAGINAKSFTQPLGRITGAANEFQKSLDASNARVIAFGASAGAIYNVQRAFTALIGSTIEVQKSLAEINVILGASTKTLGQFSDQLFEIARNSGQAFSTVATAAGELARQGLSLEQTLKRTSDALILARLSGLDAASSVEALTASINSFNQSALDSTQIVNKLASVDAAFAVSSADLAEALKRVGSSAQDVGVSFDELLAIVASVNQTTARGGAVIGNSLKTIFTRVQRTDVLNQLEALGIAVRDLQGNTAPAIQVLTGLAQKFDQLGSAQRAQVAELVGGVFQINVLKAALGDLSREYSIYGNALKVSTNASDEAIRRNEELNKTLAALLNRTLVNLTKVGSEIGALTFQPAIEKVLGGLNTALESFDVKGDSIGSKIGKGIFEGIGSFISGPGLALLIGVFGKIFLNLARFTTDAVKTVLGLNKEAQAQAQIQERINTILAQNPTLVQNILNKQVSLLQVEKDILTVIQAQTQARQQATAVAATISRGLISRGVTAEKGVITTRTKSQGFIPNFSANKEIMGAIAGGYMPGEVRSMNIPNYGRVTYNSAEEVKKFAGLKQPGIMPPENSDAGKAYKEKFKNRYGINPYASGGFIPNFAGRPATNSQIASMIDQGYVRVTGTELRNYLTGAGGVLDPKTAGQFGAITKYNEYWVPERKFNKLVYSSKADLESIARKKGKPFEESGRTLDYALVYPGFQESNRFVTKGKTAKGKNIGFYAVPFPGQLKNKKNALVGPGVYGNAINSLVDSSASFLTNLAGVSPSVVNSSKFKRYLKSNITQDQLGTLVGNVFEGGILAALEIAPADRTRVLDLTAGELQKVGQTFKISSLSAGDFLGGDFKNSLSVTNRNSMADKIANSSMRKALGFIPNFSPLEKAFNTEKKLGGRPVLDYQQGVGLYVRDGKTQPNFAAVMKDHPEGIQKAIKNSKNMQGMVANGFVPNFAPAGFDPTTLFFLASSFLQGSQSDREALKTAEAKLTDILNQRGAKEAEILAENKKSQPNRKKLNQLNTQLEGIVADEIAQRRSITNQTPVFAKRGGQFVGGLAGVGSRFAGRYGTGIALAAPILSGMASQFVGDDVSSTGRGARSIISGIGETASYAALGSMIAPGVGTAIGAGFGIISTTISAIKEFNDVMPELKQQAEQAQERLNNVNSATQLLTTSLETLSSVQSNSGLSAEQAAKLQQKATEDFAASVAKLDAVLPGAGQEIQNLYRKVGDTAELRNKIAEVQSEAQRSSQAVISGTRAISTSKNLRGLAGPGFFERFYGLLGETQTLEERYKGLKPSQQRAFDQDIGTGAENIAGLFNSLSKTDKNIQSFQIQKLVDAFNAGGIPRLRGVASELVKTGNDVGYVEEILSQIDPEILRRLFEKWLSIQKRAEAVEADIAARQAEIVTGKGKGISNLDELTRQYGQFTSTGTLAPVNMEAIKNADLNAIFGPTSTLSRDAQLAYQKQLSQNITDLNAELVNSPDKFKILNEYLEKSAMTQKLLADGAITASESFRRLKANMDMITFEKNAPYMFSDERSQGLQNALAEQLRSGDLTALQPDRTFFAALGDDAKTTADKINRSFANLADSIETGIEDAFGAFVDGSKTAEDAFRDMMLNISQQIIKEQFSIGMRSLLGSFTGGGLGAAQGGGMGGGGGGLLGGLLNSIFGGMGKAKGGVVRKYSGGGYVDGGSGTRDDVPAMLTGGEYVLRKNAVKKYGIGALNMLNAGGKVKGYARGGSVSAMLANQYDLYGPGGDLLMGSYTPEAFKRTITGPEQLGNVPDIKGVFNISDMLSSRAITDENNPMNQLRTERFQELLGYQTNVSSFKTSYNEAMRQVEEQRRLAQQAADEENARRMSAYNAQVSQMFIGGLLSAGMAGFGAMGGFGGLLGGTFGKAATGGGGLFGGISNIFSGGGIGSIFQGVAERIVPSIGGLFGGGGGGGPTTVGGLTKDQEKSLTRSIEDSIKEKYGVTSPGLGGIGMPGYGGYGSFGGGPGGIQSAYYGAGAGANVGLYSKGNPFAAGLGFGTTFTQTPGMINPYFVQPAGITPPTGVVRQQPLNVGGVSFGRGYAKGGRVRKYLTGSQGGVRGDNLTREEAMMLFLSQGINPYLAVKPIAGSSPQSRITKDIESILGEAPMIRGEGIAQYLQRSGGQAFAGNNLTELNTLFLASQVQERFKDRIKRFTAFADKHHSNPASKHYTGRALDFTVKDMKDYAKIEPELIGMLQGMGIGTKLNEKGNNGYYNYQLIGMGPKGNKVKMGMLQYEPPGHPGSTGPHVHVELTKEGLDQLGRVRASNQFAYTDIMPGGGDPFKTMVAQATNKPISPAPLKAMTNAPAMAGSMVPGPATIAKAAVQGLDMEGLMGDIIETPTGFITNAPTLNMPKVFAGAGAPTNLAVSSTPLQNPFTNRPTATSAAPIVTPQGPGIFSRMGNALRDGYGRLYDGMYNLGSQLDPFSAEGGLRFWRGVGRASTMSEQAVKNIGAKMPTVGATGAGGIGGAVMSSVGGLGNLAKTGYGKLYDAMYDLGARAYETNIFNPNRTSYANKMTLPITENPMLGPTRAMIPADLPITSQKALQEAFIGPSLPEGADFYTSIGQAISNKEKGLERYASFYGTPGKQNFLNYGAAAQDFANRPNFGQFGFKNYMDYLGFGGGRYGMGMPLGGYTTPGTLSPYAFSSRYFGGFGGFTTTGVPYASSNYFSTGSRLGITPSWAASKRATGGPIFGGSSYRDDVPAMLMGGEYVIRKDVVDRMGQPFFDRLNRGQVQGFADGGPVGTGLPSTVSDTTQQDDRTNSRTQFTESFAKLAKSLDSLNRNIEEQTQGIKTQNEQQGTATDTTTANGVTNNININVTVDSKGGTSERSDESSSDEQGQGGNDPEKLRKTLERSRALSELLKAQVLKVIVEEQRPGGVLYQGSKGRDLGR